VAPFGYQGQRLRATYTSGGQGTPATTIDVTNPEQDPKQFERQADHFTRCILENKTPDTPGEEGLKDMQHIQSIYRAAGISMD
jgi:predicted dehydrogenase